MNTQPTRSDCYRFAGVGSPPLIAGALNPGPAKFVVGSATVAAAAGKMVCALEATDELQAACWYFGDVLPYVVNRLIRIEIALEIDTVLSAVQHAVFGMSTARNNDMSAATAFALFRIDGDGASNKIKTETDDNATDIAPVDSGHVLPINTPMRLSINFADQVRTQHFPLNNVGRGGNIAFYGHDSRKMKLSFNDRTMFQLDNHLTGGFQPIVQLVKASGVGIPKIKIHEVIVEHQLEI